MSFSASDAQDGTMLLPSMDEITHLREDDVAADDGYPTEDEGMPEDEDAAKDQDMAESRDRADGKSMAALTEKVLQNRVRIKAL